MILDALLEVNPYFKFVENLRFPSEYMKFTDDLVKNIEISKKSQFKSA
jgi:hypothetical protein